MAVAIFQNVSELILFGFLPLLVTVATVRIIWHVLENIGPDEITDIRSFLTFIIVVVPFVVLICGGAAILIHDDMMAASVGLRSLPLVVSSSPPVIVAGAVIYIGLTVWLWSRWRKLRIRQREIM